MSEITINRALSEVKLLDKRINEAISNTLFIISYKKSSKKVNNIDTPIEFSNKVKADYQSITDLIKRRKIIKSGIVESNAKTIVTIGEIKMSVADAIERKESLNYQVALLTAMEKQYNHALAITSKNNELVQRKLDELLLVSFGKEGKGKVTEDEVATISKPYLAQNEHVILDPIILSNHIKALKHHLDVFYAEVDFILSESNTLTKIVIPD